MSKEINVWDNGEKCHFKESEIKVCGDDRIRLTYKKESIDGYTTKYELMCIDQNGKAFKLFIYEKSDEYEQH